MTKLKDASRLLAAGVLAFAASAEEKPQPNVLFIALEGLES